jgi:ribonuclease VapC
MSRPVLDASAIIAVIKQEPGAERVAPLIRGAPTSTLNLAEAATWLTLRGATAEVTGRILAALELAPEYFDAVRALAAGLLVAHTRHRGLSLADRACLALAIELRLPVMTADRAWADLDLGIEIRLIR